MIAQRLGKILLVLFLSALTVPLSMQTVGATTPPTNTDSWYVSSHWYTYYGGGSSIFYNYGYNMSNGNFAILDWGTPCIDSNGAWSLSSWEYGCQTRSTVVSELKSIKSGYDANTAHTVSRSLIVGVHNNSTCINTGCPPGVNYDTVGTNMAQIIDSVGDGSRIMFAGGVDVEPDWSATYGVSESVSMGIVDGWNANEYGHAMRPLFDFGALEESSWNSSTHTPYYPGGWTAAEQNKLCWKGELEWEFLQEYNTNFPTYLEHLDQYSYYDTSSGAWQVTGVLAGAGFLAPDTAWQDTLNAIDSDSHTYQSIINDLSTQQTLS